ncbi:hypothetical protein LK540_20915 [Massilia sp. IC2-278]|uniref:hypothetical protein n=1 Tax=Massilia sp. IC2-278 TaxID=2887200 RepID=UPI001E3CFC87|nr:hypothetical protein [Massilia sp. IC2-278]MCC2962899.1 hypothetical protein [Massilia sp. IC2-278]
MKRLLALTALVLVGGCAMFRSSPMPAAAAPASSRAPAAGLADANGVPIERVPYRVGVSSNTVEQLARQHACLGTGGAGLVTAEGPVEVYRMQCADGKVFMARCELRQCRKM